MHDPATGNWIVYNGEIYNFRSVRQELEQAGVNFTSHSDTEVVLRAYARWGEPCLKKFRGMFALAVWDANRQQLFVARDPMGIKPLYYAQSGPYFLFASEVRSLLGTGLLRTRIDQPGLLNYLTYGSAYDPLTLVEGIQALPAGYSLMWQGGTIRKAPYWDLIDDSETDSPHGDERHAAKQLQPVLEEAVRLQLVSDVPVGVFLSGGIDSSAVVSILSRGGVTPSTFSIVFREADYSEAEHSRAIAKKFRTDHHEITISQSDVLSSIPSALSAMDLPTMDGVNTYFVSRQTRAAGVKVALSGLGGDEVFAGYSSFRTIPRFERFAHLWKRVPRSIRGSLATVFAGLAPHTDQNRKLAALARANGRAIHPYFVSRMLFTPERRDQLYPRLEAETAEVAREFQCELLQRSRCLDPVNRVSYLESRCYMLNTLLRDADFMSMSQGLELRVPLIDHVLAKQILRLPGDWKLNGTPKKLLVEALEGSLPDEIVYRRKRGFTLPFEHWMRQELRSEVESILTVRKVNEGPLGGLLDGNQVQRVWEDFLRGNTSWSRPWSLYVLQRWCALNSVCATN
jgi:asparagine synthase (glutamine-hydrolysing)